MKLLKKLLKILLIFILLIIILIAIWFILPERTPQIKSSSNNSIATIEYINIGEVEQSVLIRSKDINNPIILFLHGGPGMPMMYLAHEFQRPLEENFTVVQWDRRGAGKTYSRNKPKPESINTRQMVDDAFKLIDILRKKYNQDKIVLIGHSFGTYLGSIMVKEQPELFSAYISIGQVVDIQKALKLQKEFIKKQASLNDRKEILEILDSQDPLYFRPYFEKWLFEFGGELKNSKSFFPLIWSGLQAPEYTLSDAMNLAKGSSFSSTNMKYNVLSEIIYKEITEYKVPVYLFVGISDFTTPHELVTEYFNLIKAPKKEIIYFKNSAHFPFFEEPEEFSYQVKKVLLNTTN